MDADLSCAHQSRRRGSINSVGTTCTNDSCNSASSLTSSTKLVLPTRDGIPQHDVVIFRFSLDHIDFGEAADGQRWKIKCRINGKTVWKSAEHKTEQCASGRPQRITFHGNATPKIACGFGDAIEFELCSPFVFGSRAVAKCALPMSEALRLRHQILSLGFTPVHDTSGKIVAHLQMDFKVSCAPPGSIGRSSSKESVWSTVVEDPMVNNDFLAGEVRSLGAKKFTEYDRPQPNAVTSL